MTWRWDLTDEYDLRIWDHNGEEISTSPVDNPNPPRRETDQMDIPIDPDFRRAVYDHLEDEHGFQPSAYVQKSMAQINLGDVERGPPSEQS